MTPELQAMERCYQTLKDLPPEEWQRALRWLWAKLESERIARITRVEDLDPNEDIDAFEDDPLPESQAVEGGDQC